MSKAFKVFWTPADSDLQNNLVETDDPVVAEQAYFRLCRIRMPEDAFLIVSSSAPDMVPNGRFSLVQGDLWDVQREQVPERKWRWWAMPEETRVFGRQKWVSPSTFAVKAMKAQIRGHAAYGENRPGISEISAEVLGMKLGRSARSVRYYIAVEGDFRSIGYTDWRAMLELAGFRVKPWTVDILDPELPI